MFAMCSYLFSSAIGQASQVIVGYLVGAGDLKSTNRQVWYTCKLSMLVSLIVATALFVLSKPIFGIFTSDPEVIRLGAVIMLIEIFLEWGRSVNIVMVRCLQAGGGYSFSGDIGHSVSLDSGSFGRLSGGSCGWLGTRRHLDCHGL